MTQLVYHPAFDPYNALLRAVRLLVAAPEGFDPMTLRILEFYLLFPEELINIRLTAKLRSAVRKLDARPRYPYDRLPTPRSLFERMRTSFEAALQTLTSRGLVSTEVASGRVVLRTGDTPAELLDLALGQNADEADLITVLAAISSEFPTSGANGLKDRSSLMEYRYDVV